MTSTSLFQADARTIARNRAEKRFRAFGFTAIAIGLATLVYLTFTIVSSGYTAFFQTRIAVPIVLEQKAIDKAEKGTLKTSAYAKIIGKALEEEMKRKGIESKLKSKDIRKIVSDRAPGELREFVLANSDKIGITVAFNFLASSYADGYFKGRVTVESLENSRKFSAEQLDLVKELKAAGIVTYGFNFDFITGTDSTDKSPEAAGFGPAILGSFAMMIIVAIGAVVIGVAASIFLEEFAPKNRWTDLIEVNISNLAAVPSIVFGILGLAVFVNFLGPLSQDDWFKSNSAFVGGLVLTLMTLPTIVISTRASLKAVPQSIRDAALGVGASKMQAVFHHVFPLAMPGILTGAIIGLSRAVGESAPLLLIGLVLASGADIPSNVNEFFAGPNTAMPAQIYQWSTRADPAFSERAWGGIIILLIFLLSMNSLAIYLRRKYERRW